MSDDVAKRLEEIEARHKAHKGQPWWTELEKNAPADIGFLLDVLRSQSCAFCGWKHQRSDWKVDREAMATHIAECEKHPLRAAVVKVNELKAVSRVAREALETARDRLGDAYLSMSWEQVLEHKRLLDSLVRLLDEVAGDLPANASEVDSKSQCDRHGCAKPGEEPHPCPFKAEIKNDSETLCPCCRECRRECAGDV